jgi:hypothetical protein
MCSGYMWLRMRISGGLFYGTVLWHSIKLKNSFTWWLTAVFLSIVLHVHTKIFWEKLNFGVHHSIMTHTLH